MRHFLFAGSTILLLSFAVGCGSSGPRTETVSSTSPNGVAPVVTAEAKPTPVAPTPIAPLVLPAGTRVAVRLNNTLSTKTASAGEAFSGELSQPLTIDGRQIAPRGATVTGVVASADDGGRVKGRAHIALRLTQIRLADGREITVSTNSPAFYAPGSKKRDGIAIGVTSGIGAAIGAIAGGGKGAAIGAGAGAGAGTAGVLATKGKAAVIPAESVVTFQLRNSVSVNI
ncbi:hypothetical protein F183_A40680 [Bryobacterales bacterium F-183]|nr:hypothetical protein F183_A40680 [Bryobacterales bacterium F-183]